MNCVLPEYGTLEGPDTRQTTPELLGAEQLEKRINFELVWDINTFSYPVPTRHPIKADWQSRFTCHHCIHLLLTAELVLV